MSVSAVATSQAAPGVSSATELLEWLSESGFPAISDTLTFKAGINSHGVVLTAAKALAPGEIVLSIPENFSVTAIDVASHSVLAPAAKAVADDLPLLALWLLWEKVQGEASVWAPYVRTFGTPVLSPLLWTPEERAQHLRAYSGLPIIEQRLADIELAYAKFQQALFAPNPEQFPEELFSAQAFKEAFCSVLSRAIFLPEAGIFALLPIADFVRHSPAATSSFRYSADDQRVTLAVGSAVPAGSEVFACRVPELSNFEIALQTGEVAPSNPNDVVSYPAFLIPGDPLFPIKKQVLQEEGFSEAQAFPLFADRFPRQLLSYLRLARLQDSAQFAKVTFRSDVVVSESNEYEVLMLMLGDCKERLTAYPQTLEDDLRTLNFSQAPSQPPNRGLFSSRGEETSSEEAARSVAASKERLAAQLRVSEKRILENTITAVRNRLAPIRGIPSKSGMADPNAEIKEVFGMMEAGFSAPSRILSDFFEKKK